MYDEQETDFHLSTEELRALWRDEGTAVRQDRWANFFRRARWSAHEAPRHLI